MCVLWDLPVPEEPYFEVCFNPVQRYIPEFRCPDLKRHDWALFQEKGGLTPPWICKGKEKKDARNKTSLLCGLRSRGWGVDISVFFSSLSDKDPGAVFLSSSFRRRINTAFHSLS